MYARRSGSLVGWASRRIAIVGSGLSGSLAAHALVQAGHEVTLYSDRSAIQWLEDSRPTGTAARFELALAYERELGLAQWETAAPKPNAVHLTFCPKLGNRMITLNGRLATTYFQAVDLRLQSHRWMVDLEAAGGRVVVEKIDLDRLDAIAARHDLVLVASGRGALAELFPRNARRSVYTAPQRKLAVVLVTGAAQAPDCAPLRPIKFNDRLAARRLIAELTGHSWHRELLGGAWRVGSEQLRRMFGMPPPTPTAPEAR